MVRLLAHTLVYDSPQHPSAGEAFHCLEAEASSLSVLCPTVWAMAPSEITRAGILRAIAEHDHIGPEAFRETYGYGAAVTYLLVHEGRQYDSKAIAGVAHLYDFGNALKHYQLSGGLKGAVAWLRREGFTAVMSRLTDRFRMRFGVVSSR